MESESENKNENENDSSVDFTVLGRKCARGRRPAAHLSMESLWQSRLTTTGAWMWRRRMARFADAVQCTAILRRSSTTHYSTTALQHSSSTSTVVRTAEGTATPRSKAATGKNVIVGGSS